MNPPPRIVLNLAELVSLTKQRPVSFRVGGQSLELELQPGITPKLLIGAMLDLLDGDRWQSDPPDPPEAREFLPSHPRKKK